MKITIGNETLDTETMNVTVDRTTYSPSITIESVNLPKSAYNILLKDENNVNIDYILNIQPRENNQTHDPLRYEGNKLTYFTKIVVNIEESTTMKEDYETLISNIWNGDENPFSWYPRNEGNDPNTDFHLKIQIYIPLISQLYSMIRNSEVKDLQARKSGYTITKLSSVQQDGLRRVLSHVPLIQNLFSHENHVTLIFSNVPLNFCEKAIDLENKEQNLIYEVKNLTEKNSNNFLGNWFSPQKSCNFYNNFIHLANVRKYYHYPYSFDYFYIALQKKDYKLPIYPSFLIIDIKPFTYLVKVINKDILKDGDAVLYKTTEKYYRLVQLSNSFDNSEFKERNEFYRFIDEDSYNKNDYQYVDNLESVISDGDILQNKGDEIILVQFKENPNKDNVIFPYKDIHFNDLGNYTFIITRRTGNKFSLGKFYRNYNTEDQYRNPHMFIDDGLKKPIIQIGNYFYYTFIYAKDYDPNKYELVTEL